MSDVIAPTNRVTFTVEKVPAREAERKTIARLMRMQRPIQKGLKQLAKRRARHENHTYRRAGGEWTARVPATKLVRVEPGASFTLTVTPQIMPDLRSVESFLKAQRAT